MQESSTKTVVIVWTKFHWNTFATHQNHLSIVALIMTIVFHYAWPKMKYAQNLVIMESFAVGIIITLIHSVENGLIAAAAASAATTTNSRDSRLIAVGQLSTVQRISYLNTTAVVLIDVKGTSTWQRHIITRETSDRMHSHFPRKWLKY